MEKRKEKKKREKKREEKERRNRQGTTTKQRVVERARMIYVHEAIGCIIYRSIEGACAVAWRTRIMHARLPNSTPSVSYVARSITVYLAR